MFIWAFKIVLIKMMCCVTDVVQQGVSRCQDWFSVKWEECMNTIQAPLINHFLCVPMQFHFLCDIMRGKIYMLHLSLTLSEEDPRCIELLFSQ